MLNCLSRKIIFRLQHCDLTNTYKNTDLQEIFRHGGGQQQAILS